ncbi:MAG: hypothetical protein ACQETD_11670 [Pseudomonadota bacterium]
MILNVYFEDHHYPLDVADALIGDAEAFFAKMDSDMDSGCQMSREWVDNPDTTQRCQIVADKLMAALQTDNPQMVSMMAAYILSRMPGVKGVRIDSSGEMQETEFIMGASAA